MNRNNENNRVEKLNKNHKKDQYKKLVSMLLILALIVSAVPMARLITFAADELINWRENDTMDTSLDVINNKAGVDDLLFEIGMEETGTYELVYYLEDERKTTIILDNTYDALEMSFRVQEYDPDNPDTPFEITQNLIDSSYLEINYNQLVPTWASNPDVLVSDDDTLDFTIERSASSQYPGIAFQMDNKKFVLKWDFGDNMLYILIDSYENGQIMPVVLTNPSEEVQTLKVLKGLEDFVVSPTYLVEDPDNPGTNTNVSPVAYPSDDGYQPGNKPGLKYNFKQPKEINEVTWSYEYDTTDLKDIRAVFQVEDIGTDDYLDFNFLLQGSMDMRVNQIPDENGDQTDPINFVNYVYDDTTYEYEITIVDDKSELALQDTIIQWDDLASSRIYNTSIDFQFENEMPEYEFTSYVPEDAFAYTYLEYQLERSSTQEAFLEVQPYQLGSGDEVEYVVLYSKIISADLDSEDDLWLKHYQSDDDDGSINIPVPFRAESYQDAYQIIVNFSSSELKSQVLNYRAIEDVNVPPTTPSIDGIENLYVIPPDDEDDENPTKIQFDLIWDALENRASTELDHIFINNDPDEKDAVYYEVLVNDIPDILDENPFQVFRVYELYLDEDDGLYKLKVHGDTSSEDVASDSTNYMNGYNDIDELLRMEKIIIYEDDLWATRIDTEYDEKNDTYTVTERTSTTYPTSYEADFEFPGVNYIRIRTITETDGVLGVSEYSVPTSLSLSMLDYEIPIVEGITYEPFYSLIDTEPTGITLDWPAVDITTYENNMLFPVDKEVEGLTYCVYISEDKSSILTLDDTDDEYTKLIMDAEGDISLDESKLVLLRGEDEDGKGNVLYFEMDRDRDSTEDLDIDIEGLDLNSNYYIRITVEVEAVGTISGEYEYRRGDPSTIVSVTTPIIPEEPGEEEAIPLAPENLEVEFLGDSKLSASLYWEIPEEITIEEDTYGFEILSIENFRLPSDLDSKDVDLEDILDSKDLADKTVELWRIFYEGTEIVLKEYDFDDGSWVELDDSLFTPTDSYVQLTDDSNSPNRVNYYYVRTINVLSGSAVKASSWIEDTLTTEPVDGPINLVVDYDSDYSYNTYYESIIRFDAPISDTAEIDEDYVMEVFVQGSDDLDYVESIRITSSTSKTDNYYSRYLGQEEGPLGYTRLYYEISGLDAGKQYNIKVRIEDRTNEIEILPDGSESYPLSSFSDSVSTRTDFNQDDYDKEQKYQQYIDYYLKKAEELKQSPYFIIGEDDDEITVKYRLSYIDGFLEMEKNGNYELVGFEHQTCTYYIPSEMVESGNDLNITYVIQPRDQYIGIKPYTIGSVMTDEIVEVMEEIDSYDSDLEDYYIKITLMVGEYNGSIYGDEPGSELVNIGMNIIGSEETEESIDLAMESEMDEAIEDNKDELIELLEDELEEGIDDDILTGIVQTVLEDVQDQFNIYGELEFDNYLDNTLYPVSELETPISVGLSPYDINTSNVIYSKITGDWKVETTAYYDNMYHMTTSELGSFIAVEQLGSDDLGSLYSDETIEVINKYKLTDVFSDYELKNSDVTVTNLQLVQTFARLIGADAENDDDNYLKEQGLDLPYLSDYQTAENEEAAYLYVQTYTNKHRMNLQAVIIKDYNAIEDLDQVLRTYQETLLKGVSLGIIELDNSRILPSEFITIEDLMNLIENIEQ